MMSPPTSHLAHHMPRTCTQFDAVLHGETPVAALLRQRLPAHVLENSHMKSSNLAPSPQPHITPLRSGSREIGGGGDMSLNDLGSRSLFSHGENGNDEGCGSGNGFFEAMEGSFVEGSGKALIRNGRIQLLEVIPVRGYGPPCIPLPPPRLSITLSLLCRVVCSLARSCALALSLPRSCCLFGCHSFARARSLSLSLSFPFLLPFSSFLCHSLFSCLSLSFALQSSCLSVFFCSWHFLSLDST